MDLNKSSWNERALRAHQCIASCVYAHGKYKNNDNDEFVSIGVFAALLY